MHNLYSFSLLTYIYRPFGVAAKEVLKDSKSLHLIIALKNIRRIMFQILVLNISFILNKISNVLLISKTIIV